MELTKEEERVIRLFHLNKKRKAWWYSIGRDDLDYKKDDKVIYRGNECVVLDRFYDSVVLNNGIGTSRHGSMNELKLTDETIEKSKQETNNL